MSFTGWYEVLVLREESVARGEAELEGGGAGLAGGTGRMTRMARGHGGATRAVGGVCRGAGRRVRHGAGGGRGNELLMARITRARTCLSHRGVARRGSRGQARRAGRGEIRHTNGSQQTFYPTSSLSVQLCDVRGNQCLYSFISFALMLKNSCSTSG